MAARGRGRRGGRESSRRVGADSFLPVVDVSVTVQLKFQQSIVEFFMAPQLQFIDRLVDILVLRAETCTHSANCAAVCGDSSGTVLGLCLRLTSVVSALRFVAQP